MLTSGPESLRVGDHEIPVWPGGQKIEKIDRDIFGTVFEDWGLYHGPLMERAHELERQKWGDSKPESRTLGGKKVHHLEQWDCPAAELMNARVRRFFQLVLNETRAHIDLSWCNIYRQWDHSIPHSHRLSVASMTYLLDPGEEDADDALSGKLGFADPRIERCCKAEAGFVTNQFFPPPTPGLLLVWPAAYLHFVTPYAGAGKPRITLAWNLSRYAGECAPAGQKYDGVADSPVSRA